MVAKKSQRTEALNAVALRGLTTFVRAEIARQDASIADLALRIGVPYCAIHRPLQGKATMKMGTMVSLLDALGFDVSFTLSPKGPSVEQSTPNPTAPTSGVVRPINPDGSTSFRLGA